MHNNPLTAIDFYKADHRRQYPKGTTLVYSNFTPRSSKFSNLPHGADQVVFFGLQYFIKHYLIDMWRTGFFDRPKVKVVAAYKRRMDNALGVGAIPVDHIEALHDLGYLPLQIDALPEGTRVGIRVPCLTIYNTHPDFFWLVNYIESVLSSYLWKPCTSATSADWYRRVLEAANNATGGPEGFVQFQGHDFSFRGMSGLEDAAASGAAHLLSFVGTDTVAAIDFLEEYYGANSDKEMIGCSVPATEHSVMCMGSYEGEIQTFRRLITELYPSGIVSVVSDTWDFWRVLTEFLPELKHLIMAREGKLVIRPDSGDPVKIICGDKTADVHSPAFKGAVELLWDVFGGTVTDKGCKLLDSHIGLIYGDSITPQRCLDIVNGLMAKGFASANVVLGIGSFTYQYVTRDTYGFAVKSTYGEIGGVGHDIYKQPKTDDGIKNSARGRIAVHDGKMEDRRYDFDGGDLQPVFCNGALVRTTTLAEIRERLK